MSRRFVRSAAIAYTAVIPRMRTARAESILRRHREMMDLLRSLALAMTADSSSLSSTRTHNHGFHPQRTSSSTPPPIDVWDALRDFGALHTAAGAGLRDRHAGSTATRAIVTFAERHGGARNAGRLRRRASGGWSMPSSASASNSTALRRRSFAEGDGRTRFDLDRRRAAERDRALYGRADGSGRCSRCRSRWDAARHDHQRFSTPSARTAPRPTAPARWISTAASSAPGISMSGNFPKTAASAAAPANGISAGRWRARAIQDVWIVPPRGELRHGDAAANVNSYGTTLRVYDPRYRRLAASSGPIQ